MAYIPAFKGYVADVPEFWFKRIDGKIYHYNQLTQASAVPNVNFQEVNAGWSLYPVAYLPQASSLEISMTSGEFDSSLFELANGGLFEKDATYKMPVTETLPVYSNMVTLSCTETPVDVKINGLTQTTSTPVANTFKVTTDDTVTTISFCGDNPATDDFDEGTFANGDYVEVHYNLVKSNSISLNVSNDRAAIGEAVLRWPVYNGGENVKQATFNGASIIGYVLMKVYRCRITAMPGFDTSYKSAATNSITLATMDPKNANADGNAYKITFIENV